MVTSDRDHVGPALRNVATADDDALQHLFAEQRARMAVVRENGIWQWFGGVPQGFGSPKAVLHGLWLQFAFVGCVASALVVAGMTRGPVLWTTCGLAAACLAARAWVLGRPSRATLRLYRRAVLVPAVIVARVRDPDITELEVFDVCAVLSTQAPTPASFRALLGVGERLQRLLSGAEPVPAELAATVAAIHDRAAAHDGSRTPLPAALGKDLELARFFVPPLYLPDDRLTSRLVFVLADPDDRSAGHTRVAQAMLWGEGGASLYRALAWEEQS